MIENSDNIYLDIRNYPLEPVVGELRNSLKKALEPELSDSQRTEKLSSEEETDKDSTESEPLDSTSSKEDEEAEDDSKETISRLILKLQGHRIAKQLRVPGSNVKLHRDLGLLYGRLEEENVDNEHLRSLLKAIVARTTPDAEIWKLVVQFVESVRPVDSNESRRPTTPPPSLPSFCGTPRLSNSGSHDGFEETADFLEDGLREEFNNCSYTHVEGFFEKYFEGKSWSEKWETVYYAIQSEYVNGRWTNLPSPLTERTFWDWLSNLQETHFETPPSTYCATKSKKEMAKTSGEGQLDVFTTKPDYVAEMPHSWANILVAGEHTSSKKGKFLQMARYARNVFIDRPRRLFLLGFTLNDTKMELYMFDRSGVLCADPFDIHEQPRRFIQVLVGYCYMSDEELGLDTFIQRKNGKDFISMPAEKQRKRKRLEMETEPIFLQRTATGRGTSCYRTKDTKTVVKFSWPPVQKSLTEPNLLRQASQRKVKGLVKLIGFQELYRTSDLRSGLSFHKKRRLGGRDRGSKGQPTDSATASFASSTSGGKRKSFSEDSSPSKRPRQNSHVHNLSQSIKATDLDDKEDLQSFRQKPENVTEEFVDRVLTCLALKPAGKSLAKFDGIPELLCAFRDAIKAHRSLLLDGGILHRDISSNNIIITDPKDADGFSGVLIDLDLATTVDENLKNARTDSQRMTGTLKYMAIEVLEVAFRDKYFTLEHTYRHDLESFFYVFLSVCANHGRASKDPDPFQDWYLGSYKNMASSKFYQMERRRFEVLVLNKFPSSLENLKAPAWAIRDALFSDSELVTGTPQEKPSVLYDRIIEAFDMVINEL